MKRRTITTITLRVKPHAESDNSLLNCTGANFKPFSNKTDSNFVFAFFRLSFRLFYYNPIINYFTHDVELSTWSLADFMNDENLDLDNQADASILCATSANAEA